jgi:chaperone required for assembly of F1-ATPase
LKRFYTAVTVAEEASSGNHGPQFLITLDGIAARSPAGERLILPTSALAEVIAGEWRVQGEDMDFVSMPCTRLAGASIDHVRPRHGASITGLMAYAASDLLCYRVAEPPELVALQNQHWQPLLDWAEETLEARLTTTTGVTPLSQSPQSLDALKRAISAYDEMKLVAINSAAATTGSLILALALVHGFIDSSRAFELSSLHETFQMKHWGEDEEAKQRLCSLRDEIAVAARFMDLCRAL